MVTITLRGVPDTGWYWQVRVDETLIVHSAGWSGTLLGAWWRASRAQRRALRAVHNQG